MPTLKPDKPPYKSKFLAFAWEDQIIPFQTWTKVNFAVEIYDGYDEYDEYESIFIPKKDGYYLLEPQVFWNVQSAINVGVILTIDINNITEASIYDLSPTDVREITQNLSVIHYLYAGDEVTATVFHAGALGTSIYGIEVYTFFSAHRLS